MTLRASKQRGSGLSMQSLSESVDTLSASMLACRIETQSARIPQLRSLHLSSEAGSWSSEDSQRCVADHFAGLASRSNGYEHRASLAASILTADRDQ